MTKETNGGWIEEIPALDSIELLSNGNVRVTTSDLQDQYLVDLHPMHLRFIAEKLGLVREMSASEADALRMVDKLARRIRLLAERIGHLGEYLALYSDSKHADLSYEQTYATATADLADEFVREIDESGAVVTPLKRSERQESDAASVTAAQPAPQKPKGGATPKAGQLPLVDPS